MLTIDLSSWVFNISIYLFIHLKYCSARFQPSPSCSCKKSRKQILCVLHFSFYFFTDEIHLGHHFSSRWPFCPWECRLKKDLLLITSCSARSHKGSWSSLAMVCQPRELINNYSQIKHTVRQTLFSFTLCGSWLKLWSCEGCKSKQGLSKFFPYNF